jgi:hypothetical protein
LIKAYIKANRIPEMIKIIQMKSKNQFTSLLMVQNGIVAAVIEANPLNPTNKT